MASIDTNGQDIPDSEEQLSCDFVCISEGLYTLVELIVLTGCPFYLVEELGGYVPLHNERMETTLEGLYIAGNITGIEGAKVAAAQGRTAGLAVAMKSRVRGLAKGIRESSKAMEEQEEKVSIK